MRRPGPALVALALLCCSTRASDVPSDPATPLETGDHQIELRHGGLARRFFVHVPPPRAGRFPVMIAFHGGGGNAAGFREYAGLDAIADREGFVVVYPDDIRPRTSRRRAPHSQPGRPARSL